MQGGIMPCFRCVAGSGNLKTGTFVGYSIILKGV
jgi:hypothetical protein